MAAASRPTPDVSGVPLSRVRARAFARFLPRAADLITDRFRVLRVAKLAYRRLADAGGHASPLGKASDDARALIRLAVAYANGDYRRVPVRSVVYALGALLYFLSPLDLIPDALIGIGYLDDVAVVVAVVRALGKDLDAFRVWERRRAAEVLPARGVSPGDHLSGSDDATASTAPLAPRRSTRS